MLLTIKIIYIPKQSCQTLLKCANGASLFPLHLLIKGHKQAWHIYNNLSPLPLPCSLLFLSCLTCRLHWVSFYSTAISWDILFDGGNKMSNLILFLFLFSCSSSSCFKCQQRMFGFKILFPPAFFPFLCSFSSPFPVSPFSKVILNDARIHAFAGCFYHLSACSKGHLVF